MVVEGAFRRTGCDEQGIEPQVVIAVLQQQGLPGIEQALLGRVGPR
jgi:hypothetical protein